MNEVKVTFSQGTLIIDGNKENLHPVLDYLKFDERTGGYRAPGYQYANIILGLHRSGIKYIDNAKKFSPVEFKLNSSFKPRNHQQDALNDWRKSQGRGVVVMPTGAGKSYFAVMAITQIKRPAIIVVPTIDLMHQWASKLEGFFGMEIGMLGGGSREIRNLTVSTYDSAVLQMEYIGNRFGLAIYDECHHLPGPVNKMAALMCIAPYRIGLTATPEREEDDFLLYDLIGPLAYRIEIDELEGHILSPYKTRRIYVDLDPDEAEDYTRNNGIYKNFLRENGINFNNKDAWGRFIYLCSRSQQGREAFEAYLKQKRIARAGRGKTRKVWELINKHRGERTIIFTADNDTAYVFGNSFLMPVITHKTKGAERKRFLDKFRQGKFTVLITSKVLNEGVDVPEASVGIVVSGSGSIREHVQRLGRILRPVGGKQAMLYELVSEGTSEMNVSHRRRQHRAYQRSR